MIRSAASLLLALSCSACATSSPHPAPSPAAAAGAPTPDRDCDGLSDAQERSLGTDPDNADTDDDGLEDGRELGRVLVEGDGCPSRQRAFATVTSPLEVDSDNDGIPDGVEDENQDGRRNPGETSPSRRDSDGDGTDDLAERVAGTHAARDLDIPEPMVFDLVRGLHSKRGELEVNALVVAVPTRGGGVDLVYAPEVELALADGLAVEVELPFHHERLEALKVAVQHTLGVDRQRDRWAHGWQAFIEAPLAKDGDQEPATAVVTHVGNLRFLDRFALVTLAGAKLAPDLRDGFDPDRALQQLNAAAILNPSVFWLVHPTFTLGLEVNTELPLEPGAEPGSAATTLAWRAWPQVHAQVNSHLRLQVGLGVQGVGDDAEVAGAVRFIGEL